MPRIRSLASHPDWVRDRVAFWLARGCALEPVDGSWRVRAAPGLSGAHAPSPAIVPDAVAREFIARGARVVRPDDLFAEAA